MTESSARDAIAEFGRSIFERGLTAGSSGNISVRLEDGWLLTPTNACLGRLDAARISKLDWDGRLVSGDPPSKEAPLHLAMYQREGSGGRGGSSALHVFRGRLLHARPACRELHSAAHRILRDEDRQAAAGARIIVPAIRGWGMRSARWRPGTARCCWPITVL